MILSNELIQINPCSDFETGLFSGNKPVIQVKNITQKRMNVNTKINFVKGGVIQGKTKVTFTLEDTRGYLIIEEWNHLVLVCCEDKTAHFNVTNNAYPNLPKKTDEKTGNSIEFYLKCRNSRDLKDDLADAGREMTNPHDKSKTIKFVDDYSYLVYVVIGDKKQEITQFRNINPVDYAFETNNEIQIVINDVLLNE